MRPPPSGFGVGALPLASADVNLDGNLDLVVGGRYSDVSILLGGGNGTFQRSTIPNLVTPFFITVADFNLDHLPDLATASGFGLGVAITLSTCGVPATVGLQPLAPSRLALGGSSWLRSREYMFGSAGRWNPTRLDGHPATGRHLSLNLESW